MKRASIVTVVFLLAAAAAVAFAQEDIKKAQACKYCGMDREKFSHSRMLIDYDDGVSVGTCSIHCAAVDLSLTIDKTPKMTGVGDFATKRLVDAEKAYWVLGGSKPGVMTKRAKWAFGQKGDAEAFMKENGGKLVTYDEAMKAAYEDMYQDTKMIRDKRKMMKMKSTERHAQ
ncbi:MAG: nitrous oxide reductase accessory protein NosL [Nitrospirota bacterium]